MDDDFEVELAHPLGEPPLAASAAPDGIVLLDTFGGRVRVQWDPDASVTPRGQLAFFVDFLKTGGLFDRWVLDCPLHYTSPNAPDVRDVLGTMMLSVLAGHWRWAHITAIRSDLVSAGLLGMTKVVSEDSARLSLRNADAHGCEKWMRANLLACCEPLLYEPWILDVDVTVKPLYGHQEGADVGYNPSKPGRPSHTYHTYQMGGTRLVLDVEVRSGKQGHPCYSRPGLWRFLESLPRAAWPQFIRGDCAWGNEQAMAEAEAHGLAYLFKLRQSAGVRKLVESLFASDEWRCAGQGWEGVERELRLAGWSRSRRVIVLRRPVKGPVIATQPLPEGREQLTFIDPATGTQLYEYAVLVTTLDYPVETIAQLYRDRADSENVFDEQKNQWGWGGFVTHDLLRTQIMARIIALVYNWWSLFVRLAIPGKHAEATTSRPLLLDSVARQTTHAGQTTLTVTSSHSKAYSIQALLGTIAVYLDWLRTTAEQLTGDERWRLMLGHVFRSILGGRPLRAPPLLQPAT
jgi:hypothetical protein